jgi:hypothetical protein
MDFEEPGKIRLQRLLWLNSLLKKIFIIILLVLCFFFFKHIILAITSVQKAGTPARIVTDIIKYHFLAFFNSFGDLTSKFMLLVSILLFINVVGITASKLLNVFKSRIFYIILFFLSIIIAFNLPLEGMHENFTRTGKAQLLVFCLIMMIPIPLILGRYLARSEISSRILSKFFYIIIYGLLVIQMFIDW